MKLSKAAPLLIILALAILLFIVKKNSTQDKTAVPENNAAPSAKAKRGLNRNPQKIVYSTHAMCRMQCRDITQAEVKKALREGKINYKKSDLQKEECQKRYAVENVANNQRIRVIVAQCAEELTVITCIDLDKEWSCECE